MTLLESRWLNKTIRNNSRSLIRGISTTQAYNWLENFHDCIHYTYWFGSQGKVTIMIHNSDSYTVSVVPLTLTVHCARLWLASCSALPACVVTVIVRRQMNHLPLYHSSHPPLHFLISGYSPSFRTFFVQNNERIPLRILVGCMSSLGAN